jgi:hypothetical protein
MKKLNLFWTSMAVIVLVYVGDYYYNIYDMKQTLLSNGAMQDKDCKLVAFTDLIAPHKTSTLVDTLIEKQRASLVKVEGSSSKKERALTAYRSILENECTGG